MSLPQSPLLSRDDLVSPRRILLVSFRYPTRFFTTKAPLRQTDTLPRTVVIYARGFKLAETFGLGEDISELLVAIDHIILIGRGVFYSSPSMERRL